VHTTAHSPRVGPHHLRVVPAHCPARTRVAAVRIVSHLIVPQLDQHRNAVRAGSADGNVLSHPRVSVPQRLVLRDAIPVVRPHTRLRVVLGHLSQVVVPHQGTHVGGRSAIGVHSAAQDVVPVQAHLLIRACAAGTRVHTRAQAIIACQATSLSCQLS